MKELFTFVTFCPLLDHLNALFKVGLFSVSSFLLVCKRFIILYVVLMLMFHLGSNDAISFLLNLLLRCVSLKSSLFSISNILVYDFVIIIIGCILILFNNNYYFMSYDNFYFYFNDERFQFCVGGDTISQSWGDERNDLRKRLLLIYYFMI